MPEFVEFSVHSRERLRDLQRVVLELQREKTADRRRSVEELEALFDADAASHFLRPTGPERARRRRDLATRPVIVTPTEQTVGLRWDLDSLVHAVMEGEYELLRCEPADAGKARLEFRALAYPYGGVGALVALVEAFGFTVTGIDDGTGYRPVAVERR
jgi:hypothetical protein